MRGSFWLLPVTSGLVPKNYLSLCGEKVKNYSGDSCDKYHVWIRYKMKGGVKVFITRWIWKQEAFKEMQTQKLFSLNRNCWCFTLGGKHLPKLVKIFSDFFTILLFQLQEPHYNMIFVVFRMDWTWRKEVYWKTVGSGLSNKCRSLPPGGSDWRGSNPQGT